MSSRQAITTAKSAVRALSRNAPTGRATSRYASTSNTPSTSSVEAQDQPGPSTLAASSSSSAPSTPSWSPVIPSGRNAAYDEALSYLSSHRSRALSRIEHLRSLPSSPSVAEEIERLQVEANVNDPATRRLFRSANGKGHMDQPTMRHLAERQWVKEGGLDLLMQRVYQLGVVPDLIPELGVTSPLTISTPGTESISGPGGVIEAGSIQNPSKLRQPPQARLQLFHPAQEGLYTLLVIDPDSPVHETSSYAQYLHYAKVDIPIGVLSGELDLFSTETPGREVMPWSPPLPPKGTGKHRYIFVILRQPGSVPSTTAPDTLTQDRSFDFRQYLIDQNITSPSSAITAISLVRAQHTAEEASYISSTYSEIYGKEIPEYGKAPKEMRFGYPLSANQKRAEEVRREAWESKIGEMTEGLENISIVQEDVERRI